MADGLGQQSVFGRDLVEAGTISVSRMRSDRHAATLHAGHDQVGKLSYVPNAICRTMPPFGALGDVGEMPEAFGMWLPEQGEAVVPRPLVGFLAGFLGPQPAWRGRGWRKRQGPQRQGRRYE